MDRGVRLCLALWALCCTSVFADDIYRYKTAEGRTIFTDNPMRPAGTVEATKVSGTGLPALAPGMPSTPADRDRAQGEVRLAEADLMGAYNRLTSSVLPRSDELVERDAGNPGPMVRGKRARFAKTPQYYERIDLLKADIAQAQKRLDVARERFYALN